MTNRLASYLECRKCKGCQENVEDREEKLHNDVEKVTYSSYQGDRIYSGDGCEAALASRTSL